MPAINLEEAVVRKGTQINANDSTGSLRPSPYPEGEPGANGKSLLIRAYWRSFADESLFPGLRQSDVS
jgi:hypothetical protein